MNRTEFAWAWKLVTVAFVASALGVPSKGWSQRAGSDALKRSYADERFTVREQRIAASEARTEDAFNSGSETPDSEELRRMVRNIEDEIRAAESREGPNATSLIDLLEALGTTYQDAGFNILAATANQRALEIVRRSYGLHSLEQARFITNLIENARSVGAFQTAWDHEQYLLELVERHPNDLRSAEILHEIAAGRMDILERYRAGEFPAEIVIGCYYEPENDLSQFTEFRVDSSGGELFGCLGGSRRFVRDRLLDEAESLYGRSLNVLINNEECANPDLSERLMELARLSYLSENASMGARSLANLYACQIMDLATWMDAMQTFVHIADWELLHSDSGNVNEAAIAKYDEAYEILKEQGVSQEIIGRLFSPEMPVMLPAFLPNPLASGDTSGRAGYIDLAFEISRHGKGRNIQILSTTADVTRADERDVVELILRNQFRPRVIGGQFADSQPIVMRYYLNE